MYLLNNLITEPSPRRSPKHRTNQTQTGTPRQSTRMPRTTDPRQSPRKSRDRHRQDPTHPGGMFTADKSKTRKSKSVRSKTIKYPMPKHSDLLLDSYDTQSFQTLSISTSTATPETEESSIYNARPRRKSRHSNVMLCGALGSEDEIVTDVVTDAKTSFRQIIDTLKKFGPDEKEAVRETLVETGAAIKGTIKKWVACGK